MKNIMKTKRIAGFTLAEMMVVLLILSIVMAASMPIITKRSRVSEAIWKYMQNGSDIYYGTGTSQKAVIGAASVPTDADAKFVINAGVAGANHIAFATAGTYTGILKVDNLGNIALGDATADFNGAIGIGHNVKTGNTGSIAIGPSASTNGQNGVSLGYSSNAFAEGAISIGCGSKALDLSSVALGWNANAPYNGGLAIGTSANTGNTGSVAIGAASNTFGQNGVSIGYATNAFGANSVAIGNVASAKADNAISICGLANSETSMAIGHTEFLATKSTTFHVAATPNHPGFDVPIEYQVTDVGPATADGLFATAINGEANGNYSLALGVKAHSLADYAVAVGSNCIANKERAISIGSLNSDTGIITTASGKWALAVGCGSVASKPFGTALGETSNCGEEGVAIGSQANSFVATRGIAIGDMAFANKNFAIAIGSGYEQGPTADDANLLSTCQSSGIGAIAIGHKAKALGSCSISIGAPFALNGSDNPVSGDYSIALGSGANASFSKAIAIGSGSKVDGDAGVSVGANTESYTNAVALGNYATAAAWGVAIGYYANANPNGVNSGIAIGSGSKATMGRSISIGNGTSASTDGIAIGSCSFSDKVMVSGENGVAIGWNAKATQKNAIAIGPYAQATLDANEIVIGGEYNKNVYVNGNLYVLGHIYNNDGGHVGYFTSGDTLTSDRRLKNIKDKFTGGLSEIKKMKTFAYTFKKDKEKTPHVGIIAQDLQKIFPDAISKGPDGFLSYNPEYITFTMLNAIKELDAMVEKINANILTINAHIQKLDDQVSALINVDKINSKRIKQLENQNKDLDRRLRKLEKAKNITMNFSLEKFLSPNILS